MDSSTNSRRLHRALAAYREQALEAIQSLRHAAACNFTPEYSGALGEARCHSFYQAAEAVRAIPEPRDLLLPSPREIELAAALRDAQLGLLADREADAMDDRPWGKGCEGLLRLNQIEALLELPVTGPDEG